jgi:hypothetical protein
VTRSSEVAAQITPAKWDPQWQYQVARSYQKETRSFATARLRKNLFGADTWLSGPARVCKPSFDRGLHIISATESFQPGGKLFHLRPGQAFDGGFDFPRWCSCQL